MASFKVKFRRSTDADRKGTIYYQISHNRRVRLCITTYTVYAHEWSAAQAAIVIPPLSPRQRLLRTYREAVARDIDTLQAIEKQLRASGPCYTADRILTLFRQHTQAQSFTHFMRAEISRLQQQGRVRTAETYQTSLNSLCRFLGHRDVGFESIDSELMADYETYLRRRGVTANTSSFYFRTLRAVYNRAVDCGLTEQASPFRRVYTGVGKTVKRAVPLKVVRRLKAVVLPPHSQLSLARDLFLFSFYTRGMSFIDMAFLRKDNLCNGMLVYRRRKTNQELKVKWEGCMQAIVDRYGGETPTPYLLPIIRRADIDERLQYRNALTLVNRYLKCLATLIGLSAPLTMYVARHSWASIARSRRVPLAVISEGMGHDSETTTKIYLTSLDNMLIDRANRRLLDAL